MLSTAMRMKPSATASGGLPISAPIAANFSRTIEASSGWSCRGPKIAGNRPGFSLPSMTLASVTVSGPPRR